MHEIIKQLMCDQCSRVLIGYDKAERVNRDYVEIRGKIAQPTFDKQTGKYTFVFVTPKEALEVLFCDTKCLSQYVEQKVARNKDKAIQFVRGTYRKPEHTYYDDSQDNATLAQQGIA